MTEIMDDSDISDSVHLRYNIGFTLDRPLPFEPDGLYRTKQHQRQKYVKFTHVGSHQSCFAFYTKIYAFWMLDVGLELKDLPSLELYPSFHSDNLSEEIHTEIYIPVV